MSTGNGRTELTSFLWLCNTQGLCLPLWAPPEASKAARAWPPAAITWPLRWEKHAPFLHPHCLPRKLPYGRRLGCSQTLALGKGWSPATALGQADQSPTVEASGASSITSGPVSKSTWASRSGSKALHTRGRAGRTWLGWEATHMQEDAWEPGESHHCSWNWDSPTIPFLRAVKVPVVQSCLTLHDRMDYSLPGSSVHGILQAKTLEWVAIPLSQLIIPKDQTQDVKMASYY